MNTTRLELPLNNWEQWKFHVFRHDITWVLNIFRDEATHHYFPCDISRFIKPHKVVPLCYACGWASWNKLFYYKFQLNHLCNIFPKINTFQSSYIIRYDFVRHNTCHFCHKHIPNTPFLIKLKFATHTFFVSVRWHGYTLLMPGIHGTLYSYNRSQYHRKVYPIRPGPICRFERL